MPHCLHPLSQMNLDNLVHLWDILGFLLPQNNFNFFVYFFPVGVVLSMGLVLG